MPSQKLVRCEIRPRNSATPGSPRYIPLEIFGLWEYLMVTRHRFEVLRPTASLWIDMDDSPEAAYSETQYERVTEVTVFVFSGRDQMFTRARRYFPTPDCDDLKEIFLAHYRNSGSRLQSHVRERQGIWLNREVTPVEVTV